MRLPSLRIGLISQGLSSENSTYLTRISIEWRGARGVSSIHPPISRKWVSAVGVSCFSKSKNEQAVAVTRL